MKRTNSGLAALLGCVLLGSVPPAYTAAEVESAQAPARRSASPGNLDVPAMESFADWPPDALRTRGYWLPFSVAAFQRARLFGRPVVFTLTVNWNRAAQRLEEEALSDPEVMRAINAEYVSVRVNADLRPDVRARYDIGAWPGVFLLLPTGIPMLSQAQTRDLSLVQPIRTTGLTPDAMKFLLREGSTYWSLHSGVLLEVGDAWAAADERKPPEGIFADAQASDLLTRWLLGNADRVSGGFGAAPKFVVPWLDEYAGKLAARKKQDLREHSRLTLEAIAESPLFDAVDGGLHRAAAATGYRAIEYEKMLVGNAAFVRDLTFALRGADSPLLRSALASTADFIVRVLERPQGGFHLAQMADAESDDGGAYWRATADRRPDAPPVDPIVLAGPNALAGAALLRAGWLLERADLREAGRRALEAVRREAYRPGRGVVHAIEPGGSIGIFLVAQADAAFGFLEGYELTGDPAYLEIARQIVDFVRFNLRQPGESTFRDRFEVPGAVGLLAQPRWPMRANARLARTMRRLALLGQGEHYATEAQRILEAFSTDLTGFAIAGIELGVAIEEMIQDPIVVRISGDADDPVTAALRGAALDAAFPWMLVATAEEPGTRPGAEVSRRDSSRKAKHPAALVSAIEKLSAQPAEED